jgi:hypothetical protein
MASSFRKSGYCDQQSSLLDMFLTRDGLSLSGILLIGRCLRQEAVAVMDLPLPWQAFENIYSSNMLHWSRSCSWVLRYHIYRFHRIYTIDDMWALTLKRYLNLVQEIWLQRVAKKWNDDNMAIYNLVKAEV